MNLQINYSDNILLSPQACFLRGNSIQEWIEEMDHWSIDPDTFHCYAIPSSIGSVDPAGLFVVFSDPEIAKALPLKVPYGKIGRQLFIPSNATIFPAFSEKELDSNLAWEVQVFHPGIGLIGFSHQDEINLHELLILGEEKETDWSLAQTGLKPDPRLTHVSIPPSVVNLMNSLKQDMGSKPIDQIPDDGQEGDSETGIMSTLGQAGLMGLSAASAMLGGLFGGSEENKNQEPGFFDKLQQWSQQQLDSLQQRRNRELNRLLRMFETNPDEALKYALPVDSPYHNRGTPPPSDRLGPRSTNFDLSQLGGGQSTDYWQVDQFYHELRKKYQESAQKAIQEGDFRKAAYIYAHLLGNYRAAANALRQGNMFREAAILFKEHLKDLKSAAVCFEKGGLLLEAIDLYQELNQQEKAGDLYQILGQTESANQCYQYCVDQALQRENFIEAARLLKDKLQDETQAKGVLLEGWSRNKRSSACLTTYADLIVRDPEESLPIHLQDIYRNRTSHEQKELFLKVLVALNERYRNADLLDQTRDIGYEILSEQASAGEFSQLPLLKEFLPDDGLIRSDVHRYRHLPRKRKKKESKVPPLESFHPQLFLELDLPYRWLQIISCGNQLLVVGTDRTRSKLLRINQDARVESYDWQHAWPVQHLSLINEYPLSSRILVLCDVGLNLRTLTLPSGLRFSRELILDSASWLPQDLLGCSIDNSSQISALSQPGNAFMISQYNMQGELLRSFDCRLEDLGIPFTISSQPLSSQMVRRKHHYYFINNESLIRVDEQGHMQKSDLGFPARKMCVTAHHSALQIAVQSAELCHWFLPDLGGFHPVYPGGFKTHLDVQDMCFLSGNHLVIAGKQQINVYHRNRQEIRQIGTCHVKETIHSVFQMYKRDLLGVLTENGVIYQVKIST